MGRSLTLGARGGAEPIHSLGDEGEGIRADGWAGHQADGEVAKGAGVVHAHDSVEHGGDGVGISLLGAGVPGARVQDGASVQQQQHMDFRGRCGQWRADLVLCGGVLVGVNSLGTQLCAQAEASVALGRGLLRPNHTL